MRSTLADMLWAWPSDWRVTVVLLVVLLLCFVAWYFEVYGSDE